MKSLMGTLAKREFGQYFELSKILAVQDSVVRTAVEKMANDILECVMKSNAYPIADSANAEVSESWMMDRTTIAARIHAVMSDSPERFLCFAAHKMQQAREDAESYQRDAKFAEERLGRLLETIASCSSVKQIREAVRRDNG